MRHPCVANAKNFIPNDTVLNDPELKATTLLVTGPNMGGKSTLLRQTCLAVVLAQMGCFVPADKCVLTVTDRIFTRIGASDRILEGKSTFFVEMEETRNVIQFATSRSIAIMDELGRGTSTFDGYSIAHAVLKHLINTVKCRALFATHYHMLLDEFRGVKGIESFHMACKADESKENVTFLYKFIRGECPESFGINVARMAGLPDSVLKCARKKAEQFGDRLASLNKKLEKKC